MTQPHSELGESTLIPADVTSWLSARGWSETGRLGDLAARWERSGHGVVVPLFRQSSDFGLRWAEMLRDLSGALETDRAGVLLSIAKAGSDIAEFRAKGAIDDSIPLGDASTLIDSVRRAAQASANSALQPLSYYGHRIPGAAREHANSVRMGQTRRGSYIIPVISRVPILEPDGDDDERDAQLFEEAPHQPFARTAMLKLAQGLSALRDLTHGDSMPSQRRINESVGSGVSHELCDAVANTFDTASIEVLDVSFSWADRLSAPNPNRVPTEVALDGGAWDIIRGVAEALKGETVTGEQTLLGYVKALDRGKDDDTGRITLRAIYNDKARNITMNLVDEDYDRAIHANNERKLVWVTGVLQRESGRALRFTEVHALRLEEELPVWEQP